MIQKSGGAYFDGEFTAASQRRDLSVSNSDVPASIKPHTGTCIARVPAGNPSFGPTYLNLRYTGQGNDLLRGRKYRASVWIHQSSDPQVRLVYTISGTIPGNGNYADGGSRSMADAVATVNGWKLIYLDFDVPANYMSNSTSSGNQNDLRIYIENSGGTGAAYVDDMRLQPFESTMACTVYDDKTGLVTYSLDNDNFYIQYVYDSKNRLSSVYKESSKGVFKVKEYTYNTSRSSN